MNDQKQMVHLHHIHAVTQKHRRNFLFDSKMCVSVGKKCNVPQRQKNEMSNARITKTKCVVTHNDNNKNATQSECVSEKNSTAREEYYETNNNNINQRWCVSLGNDTRFKHNDIQKSIARDLVY
jgi:hypothetical protein